MVDNQQLVMNNLFDVIEDIYAEIGEQFTVSKEQVTFRRARSDDFDELDAETYTFTLVPGSQQTAPGTLFQFKTVTGPYAVMFAGWDLGDLATAGAGLIAFIKINVGQAKVREWPGVSTENNFDGPWLVEDPIFALSKQRMVIDINLEGAPRPFTHSRPWSQERRSWW